MHTKIEPYEDLGASNYGIKLIEPLKKAEKSSILKFDKVIKPTEEYAIGATFKLCSLLESTQRYHQS